MSTLIIPCAGKSSRYPNIKPKWLFTHPDGKLIIQKAIDPLLGYKKIKKKIITITKSIDNKFDAKYILNQIFKKKVNILVLDKETTSASETVFQTIKKLNLKGQILIKDSDNFFKINKNFNIFNKNFVLYFDINNKNEIDKINQKSFIIRNTLGHITNIEEKKIISDKICVGLYAFNTVEKFKKYYQFCKKNIFKNEIYISYLVKSAINNNELFFSSEVTHYEDYGTYKDWLKIRKKYRTYFVDLDGVLFVNKGKYGRKNWFTKNIYIKKNLKYLLQLNRANAEIIFTSSREKTLEKKLNSELKKIGFSNFRILLGLNHGQRVLINDYSITNPNPSAISINLQRNSSSLNSLLGEI